MAISGFSGFSAAANAASQMRARFDEASRIATTGERATTYAGLGADAGKAVDLSAQLAKRTQLSTIASNGEARASYTQVVLTRLSDIATEMASQASKIGSADGTTVEMVAANARTALEEVAGLLNERYQGEAIFGGSDLENDPVAGPGQITATGMFTGIGDALANLNDSNASDVIASVLNLATSNAEGVSPFSSFANQAAESEVDDARRAVPTENGASIEVGLYANRNASTASSGSTTGSWARDMLMGLSMLANMTSSQSSSSGFASVTAAAASALRDASSGVTDEAGALGMAQSRLEATASWHKDVATQVEIQLGNVTNVDPAEAYLRLTETQTQLQASYKALSMIGNVSLVNYL
ncbi:flagellin [Roseomonas sp. 18066]|uniref:flagellin n=1 Tax=Roseomonas sp. 18066 TaxID=2681412 RepID=UPI001356D337|nr:flagellin [Roseomonas sp. 18066]